jgi:hypothetical protein
MTVGVALALVIVAVSAPERSTACQPNSHDNGDDKHN